MFAEEIGRELARVMVVRGPAGAGAPAIEAFVVYWRVRDEVHILNIATDPSARRRGHAARLLEHTIAFARREAGARVLLEVRRSNVAAMRLYRKYGFRPIGIRANYYAQEHEDAIVMQLTIERSGRG